MNTDIDTNCHGLRPIKPKQVNLPEVRSLIHSLITDYIKDDPNKMKYMTEVSLGHQYLKQLWDLCHEVEGLRILNDHDYQKGGH